MDISAGEIVCPGKEIIFTCVSRDAGIITWTSGEYVGNPIDFISRDTPGETREGSVDPNTIATLIDSSIEQGTIPVLVSTLRITVSSVSLTPSVTCIHSRSENFTFQVLGMDLIVSCSLIQLYIFTLSSVHANLVFFFFLLAPVSKLLATRGVCLMGKQNTV